MSRIVLVVICLMSFTIAYSQNFKDVKTADDVIQNYVTAIGGAEKLSKIKSIDIFSSLAKMDSVSMRLYMSKKVFFMNMKFRIIDLRMVYDFRKRSGWIETFGKVSDMDSLDEKKSVEAVSSMMWDYYLNPAAKGVAYRFNNSIEPADTTCYAIDISKNDSLLLTAYIDRVNFMKKRELRGSSIVSYSDFREIRGFGIKMPYVFGGQQDDKSELKVTKYVLNMRIDPELLTRPETK